MLERRPTQGPRSGRSPPAELPRADPGARARVGPDLRRDGVLLGGRCLVWLALAAVERPGGRQDLVGATGAGARVQRSVVAARLAHHDRLGDRPVAVGPGRDLA